MRGIFISLICLLAAFQITTLSQNGEPRRMSAPSGEFKFLSDEEVTLPFKMAENRIIITVEISNKSFDLILDTGMPVDGAILNGCDKVVELNLPFAGNASVMGGGGKLVEAQLAMNQVIKVPGLEFTNQTIIVMPEKIGASGRHGGTEGVIGRSFFWHLIVDINYDTKTIKLTNPNKFGYKGNGKTVRLTSKPPFYSLPAEVEFENGSKALFDLILDTGNGNALILNPDNDKRIVVPSKSITHFARAANSDINLSVGRVAAIKVEGFKLDNPLVACRNEKSGPAPAFEGSGNLGNQILSRFNIVFNLPGSEIYIEPNQRFNNPFEYNMAGIQYDVNKEGDLVIFNVVQDSPAGKVALKTGMKIFEINGQACNSYSLEEINELFKTEGKTLKIKTEINGLQSEYSLLLERII